MCAPRPVRPDLGFVSMQSRATVSVPAPARKASGTSFSSCLLPVSLSLKCFRSHLSFVHTFIQQVFIEAPPHPRGPLPVFP